MAKQWNGRKVGLFLTVVIITAIVSSLIGIQCEWIVGAGGKALTIKIEGGALSLKGAYLASVYDENGNTQLRFDPRPRYYSYPHSVFIQLGYSYSHSLKGDAPTPVYAKLEQDGLPCLFVFTSQKTLVLTFDGDTRTIEEIRRSLCDQLEAIRYHQIRKDQLKDYVNRQPTDK